MLILVSGGTGYIGSHSVAALVNGGHRVRVLARDAGRVAPAVEPLGIAVDRVETVAGDVTDPEAVARAVDGCDAVLHAASIYSFDSRDHAKMRRINVRGTEVVLRAARSVGADPIVHVSSAVALVPSGGATLTPSSPVGRPKETYAATKAEAETVARRHQSDGAPVVITYPPATLGPHDPYLGDQLRRVRNVLRGLVPIWPSGGFPYGDVRDVARLHAAVMEPGHGPRRFIAPSRYISSREYVRTLRRVTGRALPTLFLPAVTMLPLGMFASAVQRVVPVHLPAEYAAIYTNMVGAPVDTSATDALLGREATPFARTLADSVRWLHQAGHLRGRLAGRAATDGPATTLP